MSAAFAEVLLAQCALHPSLTPQDAIKLCYQASFGAEHLLHDPIGAKAFFLQEFAAVRPEDTPLEPLIEKISADFCRINLRGWKAQGLPATWLFSLFLQSTTPLASTAIAGHTAPQAHTTISGASSPPSDDTSAAGVAAPFAECMAALRAVCAAGQLPFSSAALEAYLTPYLAAGIRAVHHSESYRAAEQPAYRLIRSCFLPLLPLLERLATLPTPAAGTAAIIAIDGRCGAGKTTLGAALATLLQTDAVQMDDFFLPPAKRTPERLAQAGGNLDYERFAQEVLPYLGQREGFAYQRFHCATMQLGEMRHIRQGSWRVVEGSYSHHPHFKKYATLRAFVTTNPATQIQRIEARNGTAWARHFKEKWIPMEERYFAAFHTLEKADIILNTPV